jgi:Bor protein
MPCISPDRWRRLSIPVLALVLANTGCYTFHAYQIGGTGGREGGNQPGTEWKHKTVHALAWGLIRQDIPVDSCQMVNGSRFGIEEVKMDTNLGYEIVSILTLGFWVPLDVSWRCAKPPVSTGAPVED